MAIIDQEISLYAGEAVTLTFTMTPVESIAGWTIEFTVARALASATKAIIQAGVVTDGPNGVFTVSLTRAQTTMLPDDYEYDVWRTDAGFERLLATGAFTLKKSAARPPAA